MGGSLTALPRVPSRFAAASAPSYPPVPARLPEATVRVTVRDMKNALPTSGAPAAAVSPAPSAFTKPSARFSGALLPLLLGGVFIYAGVAKLLDPTAFLGEIQTYRLLPYPLAYGTMLLLPWLEVLAGLACALRWPRGLGPLVLAGLTVIFLAGFAQAWARGLNLVCGCFGGGSETLTSYPLSILRNVALLAACLWLWWRDRRGA